MSHALTPSPVFGLVAIHIFRFSGKTYYFLFNYRSGSFSCDIIIVANNWQDKMVLPWSPNSAARFERMDLRRRLCGSLSSCGQHDRFLNFLSSRLKGLNPLTVKKVRSFKELRQDLTALPHVIDIFNKVTITTPVMMTFS